MTNKNQDLTDIFDNNLSLSTREIYLCGNEGEVDEKLTMGFLKNLRILENKSKDPIIIHQYSVGGDWNAGMAMYDAIRNSPCQFVYICYGIAASMGSIIPQAVFGKGLRITSQNCEWLIHDGSSNVSGTHKQVISGINHSKIALKTMYDIYTDACNDGEFFLEVIIFTVSPFLRIVCNSLLFPLISHPIAVSPIFVCTAYAKSIDVASLGNLITDPFGVKQKTFSWNICNFVYS